jgi:hypothetical protein
MQAERSSSATVVSPLHRTLIVIWAQLHFIDMTTSLNRKIGLFTLCILLTLQPVGFAQEAGLTNIIVTNTRDDLLVYLNVEGAFSEKIREAILSGVPVSFSFFITLNRVRNLWMDKQIADITITHRIKYDSLKKEFTVTRSWENGKPVVTPSFEEARNLMAEVDSLKVVPLGELEKGKHYQMRAKAELSKLTLPFYLHYVFFFVSLWDFETDWYTIDFSF